MRYWLILLCSISMNAAISAKDNLPEKYQINGYEEFYRLSRKIAVEKGETLAKSDFEAGIYRIFVYGEPGTGSPEEIRLRKEYSIYTVPIAGCKVSDGILGVAEGYNGTMKPLLEKKFGKEVFTEKR